MQMAALLDERVQKIAIANPQVAPYGQAAVAAMQHYQVYEQARGRIVYGENISQTLQFVQLGAADAGLVALSIARAPELQDEDNYWEVPEPAHPPIEQARGHPRRSASCPCRGCIRSVHAERDGSGGPAALRLRST